MISDIKTLRYLAVEYLTVLHSADNFTAYTLQKSVNDKKMIRPVVLIDELPWHELNFDRSLTLLCEDTYLREIEQYLRRSLFQYKYFRADMILTPYIPIRKIIISSGIGLEVDETTLMQENGNNIMAHEYNDILSTSEAIEKLHNDIITYDEKTTLKRYELVSNILGDILPVKLIGENYAHITTWDEISKFRGVTPLLMDLIERPEFTHDMVSKLTGIFWNRMEQYEQLGLFEAEPSNLHCTCAASDDLPMPTDGSSRKLKNVWGRGAAQIFASVGNDMHEEFDIEYMKNAIGNCGLVYYGCCEPLDKKIDIVEKIPNLRKISITPWADVDVAAEAIGKKYVMASKPNPASVAVEKLDIEVLKKEITKILDACSRNSCNVELTLKDISTLNNNPQNIIEWEKTVMDIVKNY